MRKVVIRPHKREHNREIGLFLVSSSLRDHLTCLVSFRTIPTKKMLLLYAGEFRVPLRVSASGPEPCGGS